MRSTLTKILQSTQLSLGLMLLYALLLGIATFIERECGTQRAKDLIYHSPTLILLHALMAVNFVALLLKGEYIKRRRYAMLTTHTAFILIMVGAMVTFLTSREGTIHIREGERSSTMTISTPHGHEIVALPFEVELNDFVLQRYLGSMSPSSYESFITVYWEGQSISKHIYMNNTLDIGGYRLFQASYDPDEKGTILLANQDVAGRRVTYFGYALLAIGLILSLFGRGGRMSHLFGELSKLKRGLPLLFVLGVFGAEATPLKGLDVAERHIVPAHIAERFGALAMQDGKGRIVPINTFASQVVRKLHKEKTIGSLSPEQFLLSVWLMPDLWINIPFMAKEDGYFAYVDMFSSDDKYLLESEVESIYAKSGNLRTAQEKEILKIDEKVNIFNQLLNYRLLHIFPNDRDPSHRWSAPGDDLSRFDGADSTFVSKIYPWLLSEIGESLVAGREMEQVDRVLGMIETYQEVKGSGSGLDLDRVATELRYNKMDIFAKSKLYYLLLGGVLMLLSIVEIFRRHSALVWLKWTLGIGVLIVFHLHMMGMGMRWYIGGYAPWSNSYETMIYIAWISAMAGILFARHNTFVFAISTLFAGVVLFVSGLNWMEPEITPLVPVLKSMWLMFHVAVIVAAYGLFGISFLLGLTNMIIMLFRSTERSERAIKELSIINEISLWIALALMSAGTFLGAIWANESWGRYWGWDPKESWALITMILYAVVTHLYLARKIYSLWLFNFASMISFLSVLMTYFGVNYFLSGKHSYNSTTLSSATLGGIAAVVAILIIVGLCARRRSRIILHQTKT